MGIVASNGTQLTRLTINKTHTHTHKMKHDRNPTPPHHVNLTRRGEYDNGGISHSSKKRILTAKRIGFNIDDRDELWISYRGGTSLKGLQIWDVQLNDDDGFYLNLEVRSEAEACAVYLGAPMVIDWHWITDMGFN